MNRFALSFHLSAPTLVFVCLASRVAFAQPTPDPNVSSPEDVSAESSAPSQDAEATPDSVEVNDQTQPASDTTESASVAEFPVTSEADQVPVEAVPLVAVAPVATLAPAPPSAAEVAAPVAQTEKPSTPSSNDTQATGGSEEKKDPEKRIRFYFGGRIAAVFGLHSTHEWQGQCPDFSGAGIAAEPQCSAKAPVGGAIDGHLGIRGKYFGSEGFILGSADYSVAKVNVDTAYAIPDFAEGMHIGRAGAGAGVSFRGFYDTNVVGFNAAVGGGFLWRSVFSSLSSLSGQSEQYVAPIFRFDAGLSLFKFLTAGVLGWVEFSKDVELHPDLSTFGAGDAAADLFGDVSVFQGTQFFIGPYVGIRIN